METAMKTRTILVLGALGAIALCGIFGPKLEVRHRTPREIDQAIALSKKAGISVQAAQVWLEANRRGLIDQVQENVHRLAAKEHAEMRERQ
jgi:hypothetical protein